MATTLDLVSYRIMIDGRELRTAPGESGYALAFQWFLFMLFFLALHWFGFGGTAKPTKTEQLSPQERHDRLAKAEDAKERYDREAAALSNATKDISGGDTDALGEVAEITRRLMAAQRDLEASRVPKPPRPKPIAAAIYRGVQICLILSAITPFLIIQMIRPRVRFEGLPGEGTLVVTIIPVVWTYRKPVAFFGALTPAVERLVKMPSRRQALRGAPQVDVGFRWMIRLTAQAVQDMTPQKTEFRINISLLPDKGMVGLRLPQYVTDVLRFFEGVTGLQHDRILIQDVVDTNPLAGIMKSRLEVHKIESSKSS